MARSKGPIKGSIAFVCEENATSSLYIAEPLVVTAGQFAAVEAGTATITGTFVADNATNTKHLELAYGSVDSVTVEDVYVGVGNDSDVTFTKTLTETPVKFSGFTVTAGAVTGTANATTGAITGTGITSGSVTANGAFTVTFTAAVAAGTPVLLDFTRGV